jgi:cytochrome P450
VALLEDVLAFKRDALAFFRAQPGWQDDALSVDLGVRRVHVIGRAELASHVLTSPAFERGHRAYGPFGTMAGQGSLRWLLGPTLPTLDGDAGRARRARVRPMYVEVARRLRDEPLPSIDWGDLAPGACDLAALVSAQVFAMVCRACFGVEYPGWSDEVCGAISGATEALDQTSKSLRPYACLYGPHARRIRRARATLRRFAREVFADLAARGRDAPMGALADGTWGEDDALDEIVTTLVAGVETTTVTCCWAAVELIREPGWVAFVRGEEGGRAERVDLVVKETMRLYPAFWTMIRVASARESSGGVVFEPGDVVFVSPFLIHRNPTYWDDPERFDPTRHVARERVAPGDYMPFGFGARACVGAHLSGLVARRVVDAFCGVSSPAFLASEPDGPTPDPRIIVLASRSGFNVEVAPRTHARAPASPPRPPRRG